MDAGGGVGACACREGEGGERGVREGRERGERGAREGLLKGHISH